MLDFDKIASDLLDAVGSFGKTTNTISILSAGLSVAFDAGAASVVASAKTKAPAASVAPAAPTDAELLAAQTAAAIVAAT